MPHWHWMDEESARHARKIRQIRKIRDIAVLIPEYQ